MPSVLSAEPKFQIWKCQTEGVMSLLEVRAHPGFTGAFVFGPGGLLSGLEQRRARLCLCLLHQMRGHFPRRFGEHMGPGQLMLPAGEKFDTFD